jgi:hypothetical protein
MFKPITIAAIAALTLAVTVSSQPASARDGAVAAGIIGGIAAGAIIGSQVDRGYYGGPGYYESGYQPSYGYQSSYSNCRVVRQQVEDDYGNVRMRRVRVCD